MPKRGGSRKPLHLQGLAPLSTHRVSDGTGVARREPSPGVFCSPAEGDHPNEKHPSLDSSPIKSGRSALPLVPLASLPQACEAGTQPRGGSGPDPTCRRRGGCNRFSRGGFLQNLSSRIWGGGGGRSDRVFSPGRAGGPFRHYHQSAQDPKGHVPHLHQAREVDQGPIVGRGVVFQVRAREKPDIG